MFYSLKSLLPQSLLKYKITPLIKAVLICKEANKIIQEIIGSAGNSAAEAVYCKNNAIAIKTGSSSAISEIKLREESIIQILRKKFPEQNIEKIRFIITD